MGWPKGKPARKDLTGARFGRLLVSGPAPDRTDMRAYWHCACDCGTASVVSTSDLKTGHTRSCGCLNREVRAAKPFKHGKLASPTYTSWTNMLARCRNPNRPDFHRYGGRGISVCERWIDFANFLADMGEKPPLHSIDRIDNNGNYEPGNCRWATASEQRRNQRSKAEVRAAAALART